MTDYPIISFSALMMRFNISRSTLSRILKKLGTPTYPADDDDSSKGILAKDLPAVRAIALSRNTVVYDLGRE